MLLPIFPHKKLWGFFCHLVYPHYLSISKSNNMTTIHIDYPIQMSFRTKKVFSNDDERTDYLHVVLKRKARFVNIQTHHHWSDFVVELVEHVGTFDGKEHQYWVVGS